jgi:biopolymer transport protein ExbD
VLLIIFVITTPLLEKGLDLKLPTASGRTDSEIKKEDIRTVEITAQGQYSINKHPLSLDQLVNNLIKDHQLNPNLVVYIRADESSRTKEVVALIDRCQSSGLTRYSLRTQPPKK